MARGGRRSSVSLLLQTPGGICPLPPKPHIWCLNHDDDDMLIMWNNITSSNVAYFRPNTNIISLIWVPTTSLVHYTPQFILKLRTHWPQGKHHYRVHHALTHSHFKQTAPPNACPTARLDHLRELRRSTEVAYIAGKFGPRPLKPLHHLGSSFPPLLAISIFPRRSSHLSMIMQTPNTSTNLMPEAKRLATGITDSSATFAPSGDGCL
jgi:hypothetical protein